MWSGRDRHVEAFGAVSNQLSKMKLDWLIQPTQVSDGVMPCSEFSRIEALVNIPEIGLDFQQGTSCE